MQHENCAETAARHTGRAHEDTLHASLLTTVPDLQNWLKFWQYLDYIHRASTNPDLIHFTVNLYLLHLFQFTAKLTACNHPAG